MSHGFNRGWIFRRGRRAGKAILFIFRGLCSIQLDDGVEFDTQGLRINRIREDNEYGGLRLKTIATLAGARVPITIDVGFGDAVEPEIADVELPVLLDLPSPRLYANPRETVIAEKFQAMHDSFAHRPETSERYHSRGT